MIVNFGRRLVPHRTGCLVSLALLLLFLPLWLAASNWFENLLIREQRAEVLDAVSARGNTLSAAINRRLARLQGLSAFVKTEVDDPAFAAKFEPFVTTLLEGSSGVRYLSVAPGGTVQYRYPPDQSELPFGAFIWSDAAVAGIPTSMRVELTNPQSLPSGEIGVMAWQTVYRDEQPWGLVSMVLELQPLLTEAGIQASGDELGMALRDDQGRVFFGEEAILSSSPVIVPIILPDGTWFLLGIPITGWADSVRQSFRIFQVISLLALLLLVTLTYTGVNRQAQLSRVVAERTRDLREAQQELEERVAERTRQLTTLLAVSVDITSELALPPLLGLILDQLQQTVNYVAASIMELEGNTLVQVAYHGPRREEETVGRRFSIDSLGIIWKTIAARRPSIIYDIWNETPSAQAARQVMDEQHLLNPSRYPRTWLGVPLQLKDRIIGVLTLTHDRKGYFVEERVQLIMTFANQAAIAIENAHLYEQAQELAALRERQRLARELHDSVSQALYGISLGARTARLQLERDPAELAEPLDYVLSLAEAGLTEMRALIFELRPESLEREGLVIALDKQTAAYRARHRLDVVTTFCDEPALSLETKEAIYRVSQEALNNVVKHAQATQVLVNLSCLNGVLELEIKDNGIGFEADKEYPGHLGLHSMKERSERIGGSFTIDSTPGQGTCIHLQVPLAFG
jgi:signal transduction histidine kinase